jgi:hypothetical protein
MFAVFLAVFTLLQGNQQQGADAFFLTFTTFRRPYFTTTTTSLQAKKTKKGMLSEVVGGDFVTPKPSRASSGRKKNKPSSNISPDLAKWMSSQKQQQDACVAVPSETNDENDDDDDDVTFESFMEEMVPETTTTTNNKKTSDRRQKQVLRGQEQAVRTARLERLVQKLNDILETQSSSSSSSDNKVIDILQVVQELLELPSTTTTSVRQLLGGRQTSLDYRLAWVGSDDAIGHVGTGLHRVPLARLQEVFWSFKGQSRIEWLEVIRILGPFPNVKNILQGRATAGSDKIQIVMDSMVDGTGKELLAGKDVRTVDLQIAFCDPSVIVAVVPEDKGRARSDVFQDDGKHVMVFVREEQLEEKLDALRVS